MHFECTMVLYILTMFLINILVADGQQNEKRKKGTMLYYYIIKHILQSIYKNDTNT